MAGLERTNVPRNKVLAATGGAAIGSAASTIMVWILCGALQTHGISTPATVADAFNVIMAAGFACAAGWLTPPGAGEGVVVTGGKSRAGLFTTANPGTVSAGIGQPA